MAEHKKGIVRKTFVCLTFLIILTACSKSEESVPKIEVDLPPTNFVVIPEDVSDKSVKIVWTVANDPESKNIVYDIFLNGELVESQTKALTFTFNELLPETDYAGMVVASDGQNRTSIDFSFTTSTQLPLIFDGNVFLGTQQELIDFAENHYNIIDGSLKIGNFGNGQAPTDINDLSPLNDLIEVTESIDIATFSETLDGLHNLTTIGHTLTLVGNSSLINLDGLGSLKTLNEGLIIASNHALISLSGLQNLTEIEDLLINDCDALETLNGLQNLSVRNGVLIERNDTLTDITSLSKLTEIDHLIIKENASLTNVNGLDNLEAVGSFLKIIDNVNLMNLDGLNRLSSVGKSKTFTSDLFYWGLVITDNSSLENIDGLQMLTRVEGNLVLLANPVLASLNGLSNLTRIDSHFWFFENSLIENLDALSNLNYIHLDLRISQNELLANLDGLSSLDYLGGSLQIDSNPNLVSVCGLQNLMINNIRNTGLGGVHNNAFVPTNGVLTKEGIIDGSNCSL